MGSLEALGLGMGIAGLLAGLLWLAAYFEGRKSQQAAQAEAALKMTQELQDALSKLHAEGGAVALLGADGRVHIVSGPAAGLSRGSQSDAQPPGGVLPGELHEPPSPTS
jgi:hypothetical protein